MQDQMGAKRRLDEVMMDKLVGTSKMLPILHFTRDFVLDSQGEGWTGVLLLTDGKSTFTQEQTAFMRVRSPRVASPVAIPCVAHAVSVAPQVLLKSAQIPNV